MINIKNLKVNVAEKEILKWISLDFESGKNYLILWKNGSWKSSLSQFLMWNPVYEYISWEVLIDGKKLNSLEVNERSNAWLFLSFQNVPEIPWVNLSEYLRIIYNNSKISQSSPQPSPLWEREQKEENKFKWLSPFVFKRFLKKYLEELQIPENFLNRDLNVWFSWWEKRKIELLQARLLCPKYIILDEIDSGLDIDAFKVIWNLISKLNNENNSIILITHQFKITEYLDFDKVYILKDGKVDRAWGKELIEEIWEKGFE